VSAYRRSRGVAVVVGLLTAGVLALAACGGGDDEGPQQLTEELTLTEAPTETVSANDATQEELVAAFEAAGIPSAEAWAEEVIEYRPYPADDPNWTHLRTELAKYNPPPAVLEQIIATLEP
jgi:hypothetical protein